MGLSRKVEFACVGFDVDGDATQWRCSDTTEALQREFKGEGNELLDLYRLLWRRHRPLCTLPRYIRIININRSGSLFLSPDVAKCAGTESGSCHAK